MGRERELGELTELVARASGGAGGVAFVLGEAGIGKTRLLTAVGDIARSRGMAVLRGRAGSSPAPAPYRALAEAVLSVTRGRSLRNDPELAGYASALGVLAPGLFAIEVEREPSVVLLGEAVLALLHRHATSGAVLVLEDLHWAGTETVEVVEYLSDKLDEAPVAMLVSMRDGDSSPAERLAHDVGAHRAGSVMTLSPMGAGDVRAVIAASLGTQTAPEVLGDVVGEASGGVPLLIEELLASLVDARALWRDGDRWHMSGTLPALVPTSFAALVGDRLASLSAPARRAVEAAAVLGEQFDWRLLGRVTGVDDDDVVAALREAVRAQLVDEAAVVAPRFRFRHGMSRVAVLETLLGPERELIARRALDVLEECDASGAPVGADDAGDAGSDPEHLELVAGLAVLGRCDVAVRALINAAADAARRGACLSAGRSAELAVELAVTDEEVTGAEEVLLDAVVSAGDSARAATVGRRLLDHLGRTGGDPARRAAVHLQLAAAAVHATNWSQAEAHLQQAERGVVADTDAGARLDLLRAAIALGRHHPRDAAAHAQRAGDAARHIGDDRKLAEALLLLGRAHRVVDVDAARAAFGEALDAARRTRSPLLIARAAHEVATIDVLMAGPTRRLEEARELATAAGATALTATIDTHLTILHWLHVDLDASRAAADRALEAARRYDLGLLVAAAAVIRGSCDSVRGDRAAAVERFERLRPIMDAEIEATGRGHVLAVAALTVEDRVAALEQLELSTGLAPEFSGVARAPHCGLRALLLAVTGDPAAAGVAERLDADAAVVGVSQGLNDLALAVLAGRAGRRSEAEDRARRGFEALEPAPWLLAIGRRLAGESAVADGWGSPAAWLRSALELFVGMSLTEPADACRRLLRVTGASVPRQPAHGEHPELARLGVTAREAEVLALVAEGLSNREVAERLVLSVRTVEKHVERLMGKTQTANRAQLATFAVRLASAGAART